MATHVSIQSLREARDRGMSDRAISRQWRIATLKIVKLIGSNGNIPVRHTPGFLAHARELWDAGHARAEIARRLQVSRDAINWVAERYAFPPREHPNKKRETTMLREQVVSIWNHENAAGALGITMTELAAKMGLTRGAVGRMLTESRKMNIRVVAIPPSEGARRQVASLRKNLGETAFKKKMADMRSRQNASRPTNQGESHASRR